MNRKITSWAGKRVWIIGASSGIGAACATLLLEQGACVALSARHRASLEQLCEGQPLAQALPLDITKPAQVRAACAELAQQWPLHRPADLTDPALAPLRLHTRTRRNAWDMWGTAVGAPLPAHSPSAPEFEHYYFTLEAAVRGLGIAVAPWHLVMDDVHAGRLVAPLGFVASGYDYVLQRRTRGTQPRLDVFCAWLQAQAATTPAPPGR